MYPEVANVAEVTGQISKLAGVVHARAPTQRIKVLGKGDMIGGAARSYRW